MKTKEIFLPNMGHSVKEVMITKWHTKPNEIIQFDEVYIEVSTDKIENEIPSDFNGKVLKCFGEEGDTVKLNQPILLIEENS